MASENKDDRSESAFTGAQWSGEEIQCKDCFYRDRTTVDFGKGQTEVGYKKCYCYIYKRDNGGYGKPNTILFYNGKCTFYEKDEEE